MLWNLSGCFVSWRWTTSRRCTCLSWPPAASVSARSWIGESETFVSVFFFLSGSAWKSMVYQDRLGTQQTCLEIKSHCSKRGRFIHAVCFIATTTGADRCGKRHFSRHLYIKINILPRQAQDKHRESTQNEDTFALGQLDGWIYSGLPACVDWGWRGQ